MILRMILHVLDAACMYVPEIDWYPGRITNQAHEDNKSIKWWIHLHTGENFQ